MEEKVIDVTEQIREEIVNPYPLKAEQKGADVLILTKFERPSILLQKTRKKATYQIEYRWLSDISNIHSVRGNEFSYHTADEYDSTKGLFEQFRLFP